MKRISSFFMLGLFCCPIMIFGQTPKLTVSLTDSFPIEMPQLNAYPIYATATIDSPLSITGIDFNISGETLDTLFRDGEVYGAYWTPSGYGMYTVVVTATASNGNDTTISLSIEVTDAVNDRSIVTFDHSLIDYNSTGQTIYENFELPQFVAAYDSIQADLDITCPPGGCDPYDRIAWLDVKDPSGNWTQIMRYITPFGVGCSHTLDVTDYASLLQGNVEMRYYISTYSKGWEVTVTLKYFKGSPAYKYSSVHEIWDGGYPFGNPVNLQPVDTVTHIFSGNTLAAKISLSNTGHGWGDNNTGNAAEFYHATHKVIVDDSIYLQDLWTVCNPNPDNCSPQNGTWFYNRAGWCPGAISPPDEIDISSFISRDSVVLSYVFEESYVDLCHPQDTNCISGVTCPDCNDGFNPIYYVDGQIIAYSNTPYVPPQPPVGMQELQHRVAAFHLFPNPATDHFYLKPDAHIKEPVTVLIEDVSGKLFGHFYFANSEALSRHPISVGHLPSGIYFASIFYKDFTVVKKLTVAK